MRNPLVRSAVRAALVASIGASSLAPPPAVGQEEEATADDVAVQEKVVVTGSRIRRIDYEGPQPVTVFDRGQIEQSGDLTVSDFVRSLTFNTFGSQQPISGADTQSQSFVSLRGLGPERTLVLVNGRRIAGSPQTSGQAQNLSAIPLAAVERIEVLTDGASAVYGTDAIAGVVNIILRKDYQGLHLEATVSRPTQTGGDEDAYGIVGGVSSARGNVTFAFSNEQRDLVLNRDRDFTGQSFSSFGYPASYFAFLAPDDPQNPVGQPIPIGVFPDPRCPAEINSDPEFPNSQRAVVTGFPFPIESCGYNYSADAATTAAFDLHSFFIDANYELTPDTVFFTRGLFSYNESFGRYAATPVTPPALIGRDNPNNPTNPAHPANVFGDPFEGQSVDLDTDGDGVADTTIDGPFDLSLNYRNVPTGTRDGLSENTLVDYLAGLQGNLDIHTGVEWELAAQWTEQIDDVGGPGFVLIPLLQREIDSGALDIFAVNNGSAADLAAAAGAGALTTREDYRTRIASMDGTLSFDAFYLDSGAVPVVLGFEYRDEEWDQAFDEQTRAGNVTGSFKKSDSSGARTVSSLFAETTIPARDDLEVNLALRYDDYNDFGTTVNPRVAAAFRPLDSLLLRTSWGKAYQAPTLLELYSAPSQAGGGGIDTFLCSMTPQDTDGDGRAEVAVEQLPEGHPCRPFPVPSTTSGNPDLEPERATTWVTGFVWNPLSGFSLGVDYYDIELEDTVGEQPAQEVLDEEFRLRRAGATGSAVGGVSRAASFSLLDVFVPRINRFKVQTRGLDVQLSWQVGAGRLGAFDTRLQWTRVLEFEEPDEQDRTLLRDKVGEVGFPEDRARLVMSWESGDYSAAVVGNYIGEQEGAFFDPEAERSSWTTWDLQLGYATPWNGLITVGARNVFDRDPPHNEDGWDTNQYDIFGRVPYIRWEQDF